MITVDVPDSPLIALGPLVLRGMLIVPDMR